MDFHGISSAELLGLLGLVLGFLVLLEGGLKHVAPRARRSERSSDYYDHLQPGRLEKNMDDSWLLLAGMEDCPTCSNTLDARRGRRISKNLLRGLTRLGQDLAMASPGLGHGPTRSWSKDA